VWGFEAYAQREGLGRAARLALRPLLAWLRRWDYAAAQRVHHFIAISTEVQGRIRRFYGRESAVIFPPVNTGRFAAAAEATAPGEVGDYYLSLGRLIPYKRVDLAMLACQALGRPLWVGGTGRDETRLRALAGPTTRLLGRVPEAELAGLFARCRAFIFPGHEDFGITPVQALAAGRPVIAYAAGGALDTVQDGVNGVLFHEPTPQALAAAIERFERTRFDPAVVRASAERFGADVFARELTSALAALRQPKSVG
jgi:glycosyltransferase involved in cell wall biosynthesis